MYSPLEQLDARARVLCRRTISDDLGELATALDDWHRLSFSFLDPGKTRDNYKAEFLSEFSKVRFATGEGMLALALENVAKLSLDQLPIIPGKPNAPQAWHRLASATVKVTRALRFRCGAAIEKARLSGTWGAMFRNATSMNDSKVVIFLRCLFAATLTAPLVTTAKRADRGSAT